MQDLSFSRGFVGLDDPAAEAGSAALALQRKLVQILRYRRATVAVGLAAGLALALVYVALTPKQYQASAEVMIDSRSDVTPERDASASSAPLEIPEVESQVELIRSERVVTPALATLPAATLDALDAERPTVGAMVSGAIHGLTSLFAERPPAGGEAGDPNRGRVDGVRDRLNVRRVGSSYVVEVSFTAQDPAVAAAVVNAVASGYVRDKLDSKSEAWRGASDWLQQRLVQMGDQANAAARAAQDYKLQNQIVDTGSKTLVNEQQLQDLNTALIDARAKTIDALNKLDGVRKQIASGAEATTGEAPTDLVARLRQQYADLAQRKAQLAPDSDPGRKATADMAALRIAIGNELSRVAQQLKTNADIAQARQNSLETTFRTLLAQSGAANQAKVRSRELDRAAEAYETLYTNLLHQYTNAVNLQSFPVATARVISDAVQPTGASAPKRGLALVFGLLAGTGLGIAAAFVREAADGSVRSSEQVEQLGVPCCAMLPVIDREPNFRETLDLVAEASGDAAAAVPRVFKAELLLHMPDSAFAHAVQSMKTHIAVAGMMRVTKVIGITSSHSGEGKSTIASNLSHLFASPHRRTLLIDADVYNSSLTDMLQMAGAPGLCDVLAGTCDLAGAVGAVPGQNLAFLAAGTFRAAGHTDLLGSARMAGLLDQARRDYDCVIVDLPPAGEIVSTREIVPHVDAIVLVATWRRTSMDTLRGLVRAFDFDRGKLVGVALNRAAPGAIETRGAYAGYQARMRAQDSA